MPWFNVCMNKHHGYKLVSWTFCNFDLPCTGATNIELLFLIQKKILFKILKSHSAIISSIFSQQIRHNIPLDSHSTTKIH